LYVAGASRFSSSATAISIGTGALVRLLQFHQEQEH
jgi:hypothetical protein